MIFSEWIKLQNIDGEPGLQQIDESPDLDNFAAPLATRAQRCQSARYQAPNKGTDWLDGVCGKGGGSTHITTPKKKGCYFSNSNGSANSRIIGATSLHPGGVNAAFLDGSVKFIKQSINQPSWWALATKSGGEAISSDSY